MSQHLITTYYHCIIVSGRWWHNDHWIYKYHRAYLLHEDSNNTSLCTTGHLLQWSRRLCTGLRTLHHIQNIRPFNCPRHQCDQDQWSRVLCKTVIMESGPCYQTHHLLCILYSPNFALVRAWAGLDSRQSPRPCCSWYTRPPIRNTSHHSLNTHLMDISPWFTFKFTICSFMTGKLNIWDSNVNVMVK